MEITCFDFDIQCVYFSFKIVNFKIENQLVLASKLKSMNSENKNCIQAFMSLIFNGMQVEFA